MTLMTIKVQEIRFQDGRAVKAFQYWAPAPYRTKKSDRFCFTFFLSAGITLYANQSSGNLPDLRQCRHMVRAALAVVVSLACSGRVEGEGRGPAHSGKLALFAENLATGQQLDVKRGRPRADGFSNQVIYFFDRVLLELRAGRARWDERITRNQVPGPAFCDAINRDPEAIGRKNTHLFKPAAAALPADYKGSARQNAAARNVGPGDADADYTLRSEAIPVLQHQFYRDRIPRHIEKLDSSEGGTAITG